MPLWQEVVNDLKEIRSRYEATLRRLADTSIGLDAAGQLVTRDLAVAQELAVPSGTKRARLLELNDALRNSMPLPVTPVEVDKELISTPPGWLIHSDLGRGGSGSPKRGGTRTEPYARLRAQH